MRISPSNEPRTLTLFGGQVTVVVKPSNSVLRAAALAKAKRQMRLLKDGGEMLELYGLSSDDYGYLEDEDILTGLAQLMYAVELGELLIVDWQGLQDEDGTPLPLTREAIIQVMKQAAEDFLLAEALEADQVDQEGNVSAPSPNGTGAGARNTAKTAKPKVRHVPEAKKA